MAFHNDIVRELSAVRQTIAAFSRAEASPLPTVDEVRAQLARLDGLIERVSQPNPDSDGFYWWLIAVGINTKWVEDGVDFTDVKTHKMLCNVYKYAQSHELKAVVLGRPDDAAVAAQQGYATVESYLADRDR